MPPPSRTRPNANQASANPQAGEIYVEFQQVGHAVRVAAVDAATGTEVVIMGPKSASQAELQRIAVQKLKAQMAKSEAGK